MEIDLIIKTKSLSKMEIMGLTVWASGTDTCQLAGGGAVGIGSLALNGDRMGISYENYSEGSGKIYSRAALFYFTDQCSDSIGVVFV